MPKKTYYMTLVFSPEEIIESLKQTHHLDQVENVQWWIDGEHFEGVRVDAAFKPDA